MKRNIRALTFRAAFSIIASYLLSTNSFATTIYQSTAEGKVSRELNQSFQEIYNIISIVILPVAALCISVAAFHFFLGGEHGVQKAKKTIFFTICGIAIAYLAPSLVLAVNGAFKGVGNWEVVYSLLSPQGEDIGLSDGVRKVISIAEAIMLPLAGLSIIYGGLCFFGLDLLSGVDSERQMSKGKRIVVTSLVVVAAFYFIPIVVSKAIQIFGGANKWTPPVSALPYWEGGIGL